jgi:hypothetical protein
MGMCVSNLRDKGKQHAKQNDSDVGPGQTPLPWVCVHVAVDCRVVVRERRGCLSHCMHSHVPT